jgi:ABC-type uncharacterized transport system permease subunit
MARGKHASRVGYTETQIGRAQRHKNRAPPGAGLDILLHVLVAALYAAAAWLCRPRGDGAAQGAWRAPAIALALCVHAVVIGRAIVTPEGLDLSFVHSLSLVAGLAVLVAWVSGALRILPGVAIMILPVAALCAALPALARTPHRFPYGDAPYAAAHISIALVAYALFVVAALQAVVLTGIEKGLHRAAPAAAAQDTPPLLTLERYLFRLIGIGFVLLTITLVSGVLFSEQLFGRPLALTHKNVFSVAGWLVYAALLFGRWRYGWRGRTALKWILGGTLLLVLGYLGSKFVLEVLLHRA